MEEKDPKAAEREAQEQAKQAQEQAAQAQEQAKQQAEQMQKDMKKQVVKGMTLGALMSIGRKLFSALMNKIR